MVEQHDGHRLAALMKRARVNDTKLAEATGATIQAVGKWKRTGEFARRNIVAICRCIHASADELLGLVPIDAVREEPARYDDIDPKLLVEAIIYVERQTQRDHVADAPDRSDTTALAIAQAYELMRRGEPKDDLERLVGGMLRKLF